MQVDNIDDEIAKYVKKTVATGVLDVCEGPIWSGIIMSSLVTATVMNKSKLLPIGSLGLPILSTLLRQLFDNLLNASKRRKQQYKLAVVLFCYKYMNEFLGLETSNDFGGKDAGNNEKMDF